MPTKHIAPETLLLPHGLTLLEDFVSLEEEERLLKCVSWRDDHQVTGEKCLSLLKI